MKSYEVTIHIRAECPSDAEELLECFTETNLQVVSGFKEVKE
jgi:hypothetical protein